MTTMSKRKINRPRRLVNALFLAILLAALFAAGALADHRDGPIFENIAGRLDIGDLYVFKSPANGGNTVLIMTVSPFAGGPGGSPTTFQQDAIFDIKIATDVTNIADNITLRATFSAPDAGGQQDVLLRVLPAALFGGTGILAKGKTNTNLPVFGGGTFRAGVQDDPYFFDEVGFRNFINGGAFPRPVGTATNRYGPNANILAITLEIPSIRIASQTGPSIGIWARTELNGVQQDRAARPFVNEGMIPPVPRGSNFPIGAFPLPNRQEKRDVFNLGHPRNDVINFKNDVVSVFQNFYNRSAPDSDFLANAFLPDLLFFQIGNPGGFGTLVPGPGGPFAGGQILGNGRRLGDDVMDITLNLVTNGAVPGDNVGDDNGLKVTDGSIDPVSAQTRAIAFPYIGSPNPVPSGP
jgi:uncharacterized protein DUF4331